MRLTAIAFVVLTILAVQLPAQNPAGEPTASLAFEVASIKLRGPEGAGPFVSSPDRYNQPNASLPNLIRYAYELQPAQLTGGPDWMASTRFDVTAKAPFVPTPAQMRLMVRRLLAERFALKVHTETREMPIYALVQARSDSRLGAQLTRTTVDCATVAAERRAGQNTPPSRPDEPIVYGFRLLARPTPAGVTLRYLASSTPMRDLAAWLSAYAMRVVVDRTGLVGNFDVDLSFTPAQQGPAVASAPGVDEAPSVFTAVQEQLGLKLDSDRGPVTVVVVDSAQMPTPD